MRKEKKLKKKIFKIRILAAKLLMSRIFVFFLYHHYVIIFTLSISDSGFHGSKIVDDKIVSLNLSKQIYSLLAVNQPWPKLDA